MPEQLRGFKKEQSHALAHKWRRSGSPQGSRARASVGSTATSVQESADGDIPVTVSMGTRRKLPCKAVFKDLGNPTKKAATLATVVQG